MFRGYKLSTCIMDESTTFSKDKTNTQHNWATVTQGANIPPTVEDVDPNELSKLKDRSKWYKLHKNIIHIPIKRTQPKNFAMRRK